MKWLFWRNELTRRDDGGETREASHSIQTPSRGSEKADDVLKALFASRPVVRSGVGGGSDAEIPRVVTPAPLTPSPRISSCDATAGETPLEKSWWWRHNRGAAAEAPESKSHHAQASQLTNVGAHAAGSCGNALPTRIDWRLLPPSPIAGYVLEEDGLHDLLSAAPNDAVAPSSLRQLIAESAALEERARYEVDMSTPKHVSVRGVNAVAEVVSSSLTGFALYVLCVRFPRNYVVSAPRESLAFRAPFFRRFVPVSSDGLPASEVELEDFARRHRWLLRLSTPRVLGSAVAGLGMLIASRKLKTSRDDVDHNPDVELSKAQVSYRLHTKTVGQWLRTVYYHHPAYTSEATSCVVPSALMSPRS